jgi:hypothetical protein
MTKCHSLVYTAAVVTQQSRQLAGIKMAKALYSKTLWHDKIQYSRICAAAILFFNILQILPYQNLCAF